MAIRVITAPTREPVSLQDLKSHCRITGTDEDDLLRGYLAAARQLVETRTRRTLCTATLELTLDSWANPIELTGGPVQSVTSITYVDTGGASTVLDASQYQVDLYTIVPRIRPAYGLTWPSLRSQMNAVAVRYVAGYGTPADVPAGLRLAIQLLAAHWHENREAVFTGSISKEMEMALGTLLSQYWTGEL